MNAFQNKPMLQWAEQFLQESPDPLAYQAVFYCGPQDVECLPVLAQAVSRMCERAREGNTLVVAHAFMALAMIDHIIDGFENNVVPQELIEAVSRAASGLPAEAGERAKHLAARLGLLRARSQASNLLARLRQAETPEARAAVYADLAGLLKTYPSLRKVIDISMP